MIGCFAAAAAANTTCSISKAPLHRHSPGGRMPVRCPPRRLKYLRQQRPAPTAAAIKRRSRSSVMLKLLNVSLRWAGKASDSQSCLKSGLQVP
jgi:hypothetical protein